jgi:hypothetical protein
VTFVDTNPIQHADVDCCDRFSSDDREVIGLVASKVDREVINLVSSESSSEASADGAGSSSSSDASSSHLPSWTCLPDGNWIQADNFFYDCDGGDWRVEIDIDC